LASPDRLYRGPGSAGLQARTPLLMYLFYRVRLAIDGSCRVIQVFDEFARYLDDPAWMLK
jgi:type IV secretion system protein VirB4